MPSTESQRISSEARCREQLAQPHVSQLEAVRKTRKMMLLPPLTKEQEANLSQD